MDICGSQSGIYEPLWKFTDYNKNFTKSVQEVCFFGWNRLFMSLLPKIEGCPAMIHGPPWEAAKAMNKEISRWEAQHMALGELLNLDQHSFEEQKASLLHHMDVTVKDFVGSSDLAERVKAADAYDEAHPGLSSHKSNLLGTMIPKTGTTPLENEETIWERFTNTFLIGDRYLIKSAALHIRLYISR